MIKASIVLLVCATILCVGQAVWAADAGDGAVVKRPDKAKVEKAGDMKQQTSEDKEAAYTKTIEKRTADILVLLDVKDEAKLKNVRDAIMSQYRFLSSWHDTNDAKLGELGKKSDEAAKAEIAKIKASLKTQHDKFVGELAANLTPEQVDKVKDKMVYGKVQVTYNAYLEKLPKLNEEQKSKILDLLKQGREEAMDAGSAEQKTAIFGKYKGKVNNYLSSQGIDLKQAESEWKRNKAQRAADGTAATPSAEPGKESAPATERK